MHRLLALLLAVTLWLDAICLEHTGILDAIEDRDPDRAARLAFEHARSCTDDLVDRVAHRARAARPAGP